MITPPTLSMRELRDVVRDGEELTKGTRVYDEGGLAHLSRFAHKLFAEAKGSGSAPYKVQILFEDGATRGRCSCFAARTRPFCKHSAALLVAWARAPGSFAEAAAAPAGAAGEPAKKKRVKQGKVDDKQLIVRGVDQVGTLIRELAVAGVASLAADRVEQVRELGGALREVKLRRLSARTLTLAGHLERAAARSGAFDASEYAELLGDMLLTARKLEKHVAGEPIADEHVEELIGKTWTKKHRKPIEGLHLVEYGFVSRTTSDDFVIRESRFLDLETGEHYSEKQILPQFLVKRSTPKPSYAGKLLAAAAGSLYPSFSPRRLALESPGESRSLDQADLERVIARALPTASDVLSVVSERGKDIFAPPTVPIAFRVEVIAAEGSRLKAVDAAGEALYLPDEGQAGEVLSQALRGGRLCALLGDAALDGALPTLFPMGAVVEDRGELALVPLTLRDATAVLEGKKVRLDAERLAQSRPKKWVEVARQLGVSEAAVSLGEVREEMAEALATGLATVVPRFAEPLASRLVDLSLAKQGALLTDLAAREDPAEKLDDFVKLYRVLDIALSRLAGATSVDRGRLEAVPGYPSVLVPRTDVTMNPAQIVSGVAEGALNRYEAAVAYARFYGAIAAETLATEVYPTWADGSASAHVVARLVDIPDRAVEACARVLAPNSKGQTYGYWTYRTTARMARLTAIAVLEGVGSRAETSEALRKTVRGLLVECIKRRDEDPALGGHATRALRRIARQDVGHVERLETLRHAVLNSPRKEDRIGALYALAKEGHVEAVSVIRASYHGDVSADVRSEAARALAMLGDAESVDTFVRALRARHEQEENAKTAARALGILGDIRGLDALMRAWAEGWHPGIVAEAIRTVGPAALEPMVAFVEAHPELVKRKAALTVLASLPAEDVIAHTEARLETYAERGDAFVEHASLLLSLLGEHKQAARACATKILALRPSLGDATGEKVLRTRCEKLLGTKPKPEPGTPPVAAPTSKEPKRPSFLARMFGRK